MQITIDTAGRFVAFDMVANSLDGPNTSPPRREVYLRDRQLRTTQRISVLPNGQLSRFGASRPYISGDGKFVAFACDGDFFFSNVPDPRPELCLLNLATRQYIRVSKTLDGQPFPPLSALGASAISSNGGAVYFSTLADALVANDSNQNADVFVYRRSSDTAERLSTGRKATMVTSNLDVSEWSQAFASNQLIAVATIDRLRHRAYQLTLEGKSWRTPRAAQSAPAPPASPAKTGLKNQP